MKSRRLQKAVFVALSRGKRNTHKGLVEMSEVRIILGNSRYRWDSNTKMDVK
jgi:hypothetical protein